MSEFTEYNICTVCGKKTQIGDTYKAIFNLVAYSIKENDSTMCAKYTINTVSLEKYNQHNTRLKFGIVASVILEGEELDILEGKQGDVAVKEGARGVLVPLSDGYISFDFVLKGFNSTCLDYGIVMNLCAYDGEKISYITDKESTLPTIVTLREMITPV